MIILTIFAASLLAALSQGVESSPIIVALMAVLALPGATTAAVTVIRTMSDAFGVNPRAVVYVLSLVVTGLLLLTGTVDFPSWAGDPTTYVAAWLTWAQVNTGIAKTIYELLTPRLAPEGDLA